MRHILEKAPLRQIQKTPKTTNELAKSIPSDGSLDLNKAPLHISIVSRGMAVPLLAPLIWKICKSTVTTPGPVFIGSD